MNRIMFAAVALLAGSIGCASAPANGPGMNLQLITQQAKFRPIRPD